MIAEADVIVTTPEKWVTGGGYVWPAMIWAD